MDKEEVISELRRVAEHLNTENLSQSLFKRHGRISLDTACSKFGSWNQALESAGLDTYLRDAGPPVEFRQDRLSEDELLEEIIRLTQVLGKKPTIHEVNAKAVSVESLIQKDGAHSTKRVKLLMRNTAFQSRIAVEK